MANYELSGASGGSATEAKQDSILSAIQDNSSVEVSNTLITSSSIAQKIGEGKLFTAGSDQTVTAGSSARWSIKNPSGSGKTVYLLYGAFYNDDSNQIIYDLLKNSTISNGTALTPWNAHLGSLTASIAEVKQAPDLTGGTDLDTDLPVSINQPYIFEGLLIIPEDSSLSIRGTVPGTLSAQELAVVLRWYEE